MWRLSVASLRTDAAAVARDVPDRVDGLSATTVSLSLAAEISRENEMALFRVFESVNEIGDASGGRGG